MADVEAIEGAILDDPDVIARTRPVDRRPPHTPARHPAREDHGVDIEVIQVALEGRLEESARTPLGDDDLPGTGLDLLDDRVPAVPMLELLRRCGPHGTGLTG